ncbi:MAG: DUF2892 domain-containing protein [Nocardioidaceae bacterium]|nr:DUF2892 domain-containing protein [Nocardioidaceae bacterium]
MNASEMSNSAFGDSMRILDVRTPAEYETARIPNSHNIPLADLNRHAERLAEADGTRLLVVCQSGGRARQAAAVLDEHGHRDAVVLEGGLNAWRASGHDVEQGEPKWTLERQVRLTAGAIVATSIAASLWVPKARFLAGAVGGGLVFAAVTDTCAMGNLLSRLPYNRGSRADIDAAAHRLAA